MLHASKENNEDMFAPFLAVVLDSCRGFETSAQGKTIF